MSQLYTPFLPSPYLHGELSAQTLEQATDAVIVSDEHQRIVLFNAAAEALWGRTRSEMLGHDIGSLLPSPAPHARSGHPGPVDIAIHRKDGRRLRASLSVCKVQSAGHVLHAAFVKDITAQHALQERTRLIAQAADSMGTAIIVTGADMRITYVNQGFSRMLGYGTYEAIGCFPTDLLCGPHTDGTVVDTVRNFAAAGQELRTQALIYARDGRPLWVSLTMNPIRDASGAAGHMVSVLTEITHTKMHELLQHKVLEAMARDVPLRDVAQLLCNEVERLVPQVITSLREVDPQGRLLTLAAPSLPPAVQRHMDGLVMGPDSTSCGAATWNACPHLAKDIATDPCWSGHGAPFLTQGLRACWSHPVKSGSGAVLGCFALYYRDSHGPDALHERLVERVLHLCALLLERERERAHIHQLAHYDALTGLANRRMLLAQTQRMQTDMQAVNGSLALFFINLDRFKQVNDAWGHSAGDQLLCTLATRLRQICGAHDIVAHLGGGEFAVTRARCSPHQAALTARRLLTAISRPLPLEDSSVLHPGASIGVAMYPGDGNDAEHLMRHADLAMQQAKAQGGRRYCFYQAQMNTLAQERTRLETDLRVALREGGLQLHYQPQVHNTPSHPLRGVEALVRWQHPHLGQIPPIRFVTLAEELGLMDCLSQWVLQESCRQLAIWRNQKVPVPHVCINLSAINLRNGKLPQQIASALRSSGLNPGDLRVEVTETTVLDTHPMTLATARALHEHGVLLSLDDFGTGYSSLAALHSLPISMLKLDQSFIKNMVHSPSSRSLTSAVLHIGKSLGMEVVAEGVETEEQRALLQEFGCPVLQGYLFARPMPAQQLQDWIAQRGETAISAAPLPGAGQAPGTPDLPRG